MVMVDDDGESESELRSEEFSSSSGGG